MVRKSPKGKRMEVGFLRLFAGNAGVPVLPRKYSTPQGRKKLGLSNLYFSWRKGRGGVGVGGRGVHARLEGGRGKRGFGQGQPDKAWILKKKTKLQRDVQEKARTREKRERQRKKMTKGLSGLHRAQHS